MLALVQILTCDSWILARAEEARMAFHQLTMGP